MYGGEHNNIFKGSRKFQKENPKTAAAMAAVPIAIVAAPIAEAGYIFAAMNPEAIPVIGGAIWGLGTDADMPGGGDDIGRGLKALFRGTSKGFKGSNALQRIGVTPASTDPLVATLFGIESNNKGKGVLHIALESDLNGASIIEGNVLSSIEKEVGVEMLPEAFSNAASISLSVGDARKILTDMGFNIPSSISGKNQLNTLLNETPRLDEKQINTFINHAKNLTNE